MRSITLTSRSRAQERQPSPNFKVKGSKTGFRDVDLFLLS
jgi:hypothetical protein